MLYGVRCISVVCRMRGTFQKDSVCSPTISAYAVYSAAATEGCPFHLRDTVDTTHNRIGLCPIRYDTACTGWAAFGLARGTHACTPERSCYCLLNGSVEFVSVDGMIGSMISACQSATVRLRAQSILSSKPPKQSTRGAEKHKSEAVRQCHKECL